MTDKQQKAPTSGRTLRRLRAQFRNELLGDADPTPSDQTLIDLAAQAALRVREMRAEISAGNRVPDEDLVRNCAPSTYAAVWAYRTHPILVALSHRYRRCGGQMWFPGKIGHGHAYSATVMAERPCAMAEHSAITADARAIGLVK
jgi:hypothetical protein